MPRTPRCRSVAPFVELLEAREVPSTSPWLVQSFDSTAAGALPSGWAQWSSSGTAPIRVSSAQALSAPNGLAITALASNVSARTWLTTPLPADFQVSAAVYVTTLLPAQVFGRGSGLNTANPSYYAVTLTRGMPVQLVRVVNGVTTVLGQVNTAGWFSDQWVQATLSASGTELRVQVYRPDTRQYLNNLGRWQSTATWVLDVTDTALAGPGLAGLGEQARYTGTVTFDDFTVVLPDSRESFDTTPTGTLPAGWSQWSSSSGSPGFAVSAAQALSAPNGLAINATASNLSARAWDNTVQPADVQVSAAVYLNTLIPAQVLARGSNLNTATPSYYAAVVTRGMQVQLVRMAGGVATVLGQVQSASWVNALWVRVTLYANGSNLRAQVFRPDTAQYLNSAGQWQATLAWAVNLTDTALAGTGLAGLGRAASYVGTITFDDFLVTSAAGDNQPPVVTITAPAAGATLSGVVTVQASATDNVGVTKVEFYVDNVLRTVTIGAPPYRWDFDTSTASNGTHTLQVLAYDAAGNVGLASLSVVTQNNSVLPRPTIPSHYPQIRIAEVAYTGTPFGPVEDQLLSGSVDLVITDPQLSAHIHQVAPNTPQLIYTNTSSLYLDLLTDWLAYADAHGLSREGAFYHVSHATSFSGNSASSQPVAWFWGVYRDGPAAGNFTAQAHDGSSGGVAFAGAGASLAVGYPERFREINMSLASGAAGGWSAALEYVTAVDAAGNPTAWAPLPALGNTTAGLTHSGQVTFDPPADWKPARVGGSARLYYVRFRTTTGGTAPVAAAILGRDYVGAGGTTAGVIPAFDATADTNHDGYLSDAEYAHRQPGMDARFVYESRDFAAFYGQMRFATNPAYLGFRNWAIDFDTRLLNGLPASSGLFMDNASGSPLVNAADVLEPTASYPSDYGALLNAIGQAIGPRWILSNTAGSSANSDAVIQKVQGYFEEFALRPLASNYLQFESLAALTAHRAALTSPAPYAVLDSLPTGGSPTDPRTQLATLAYYYLLADPSTTFLDFYGGFAPETSWTQHWSPAAAYNIGQPAGAWSLFASGSDPSNSALSYHVYQRSYGNALVLYKPLSYGNNVTGTLADATATTHALNGTYYALRADGTPGPAITSITLRNGEGAILIKAGS